MAIRKMWIVDRKGKRAFGSKERMRERLDYAARIVETTDKPYELKFWAEQAWHWALALKGR